MRESAAFTCFAKKLVKGAFQTASQTLSTTACSTIDQSDKTVTTSLLQQPSAFALHPSPVGRRPPASGLRSQASGLRPQVVSLLLMSSDGQRMSK